jgi:O-antigen ligase
LLAGLATWVLVRAIMRRSSPLTLTALVLFVLGSALLGWWIVEGWGVGKASLEAAQRQSIAGRLDKSTGSRLAIWKQLGRTYLQSPLGIGPGNSKFLRLSIATRERPESLYSKEAHNDYLGYAVERGPFALLALLALIGASIRRAWSAWSGVSDPRARAVAGTMAAAFMAGMVATSVHSFMIEKLHFRHFWFFLALLWALSEYLRREAAGAAPAPVALARGPGSRP